MSNIRKQAITSSILLYIGFAIGALNIFLYTRHGAFSPAQYGFTRLFFDFAQNIYAFASLGAISVMYKFYPYFNDNLADKENDLLTWVLCASLLGFIIVLGSGIVFQPFMIRKFSRGSKLFIDYYFWVFPLGFGLLLFSVLEAYAWVLRKTVLTNFLRETLLRILTTVLILLYYAGIINFPWFVYYFSSLYFLMFCILLFYVIKQKKFHLTFKASRVTKKYWKKMLWMQALLFSGVIITALGQTVDGILISSIDGLGATGVFTLSQYMANLVQVPQRSLQAITVGALAKAWKDKNMVDINRIYTRSCINMLLASLFIYGNVVLNAADTIHALALQADFLTGINVLAILGLVRIIDAGTGVNGMVILTSSHWRFDFYSGLIMIVLIIPTNYFLIKSYGIIGSAYAQLISFCIYNYIRFEFIRRKFNMQPFDTKTLISLVLTAAAFGISYYIGSYFSRWEAIVVRSFFFSSIMIAGVFQFRLTPDAHQLWHTLKKKISL